MLRDGVLGSGVPGEIIIHAATGSAQALGINSGQISVGTRADLLVLDDRHPTLYGKRDTALLDSWIFACNDTPVKHVMVGGSGGCVTVCTRNRRL